jgi:hypothetical protein
MKQNCMKTGFCFLKLHGITLWISLNYIFYTASDDRRKTVATILTSDE